MSLFSSVDPANAPLATRMRPNSLIEYVGQEHILGEGQPLRKAILDGRLGSVILWAPPGCGKTTLANLIAKHMDAHFDTLSAVTAGVSDVRSTAIAARDRLELHNKSTLLLVDEIHHFNKSQQDSLLGYVEDGTITLIGATTENPTFCLNSALLSRAKVLPLKEISAADLEKLILRALNNSERGLGSYNQTISGKALEYLIRISNGDARIALNSLETASLMTPLGQEISVETLERLLQKVSVKYDRDGDNHFDTISALIKSVRACETDAALHYLARMLEAGEDPKYIARRLAILASEDIGNAEPQAVVVANSIYQIVTQIGMPEARIPLSQLTIFLAEAPKSRTSYSAIEKAIRDVRDGSIPPIPKFLKSLASFGESDEQKDQYLPDGPFLTPYFQPSEVGYEKKMTVRRRLRGS